MNTFKLKTAEQMFLSRYPEGFSNPEMIAMGKKHKMEQLTEFAQEKFTKKAFKDIDSTAENMVKLVSSSSMVSVFEKPKFRDAVISMNPEEKTRLVTSLKEMLHGNEEIGFDMMLSVLLNYKLAKWTLVTVFACYYRPQQDLLFKPTTVKNTIAYFELEDLKYNPKPTYEFFEKYRNQINTMKELVDPSLSPNNAAFSGFLMMIMDDVAI